MVGSLISTLALTNTTRANIITLQREITEASQELSTGFAFDVPAELGARTGLAVELRNEFDRLGRYETNIDLFEQRATVTQSALDDVRAAIDDVRSNVANTVDDTSAFAPVIAGQASSALEQVVAILNTSFGGELLFAGTSSATLPFQPVGIGNANGFAPGEVVQELLNRILPELGVTDFTSAFEVDQFIEGDAFLTAAGGFQGLNSVFDDTNNGVLFGAANPGGVTNAPIRYLETFYNGGVAEAVTATLLDLEANGVSAPGVFDTNADGVVDVTDGAPAVVLGAAEARNFNTGAATAAVAAELTRRGFVENVDFAVSGATIDVNLAAAGRQIQTRVDDQTVLQTGIQGDQQPFRDIIQGLVLIAAFDIDNFRDANGDVVDTALQRYLIGEPSTPPGVGSVLQSLTNSGAITYDFDPTGDGRVTNEETTDAAVSHTAAVNRLEFTGVGAGDLATIRQQLLDAGYVEGLAAGQGDFFIAAGSIEIDLTAESELDPNFVTFSGSVSSPREGALGFIERGLRGLLELQAELGTEQRTAQDIRASIDVRRDLLNVSILDLEGVDPAEAATRLNQLDTQLRAAFSVTSRIQQLSLSDFI